MCGIDCASRELRARSSRPPRCVKCIGCRRAFRESSTCAAIARCSAPTRGNGARSRLRWFAVRPARCMADTSRRCGWDGSPAAILLAGLGTTVLVGLHAWQHQTSALRTALKTTPSLAAHPSAPAGRAGAACRRSSRDGDGDGGRNSSRSAAGVDQRVARRQRREHHGCGGVSPLAVSLGIGDGERPRSLRSGREGRPRLPGTARFLGAGARAESAGHPHAHRRSGTAAPRGVVRPGR